MDQASFQRYIDRFNAQDATAFDDYLLPDVTILNGGLELVGVEGMKAHYVDNIWPHFIEKLNVQRFVCDDQTLAVRMWTNFTACHATDSIFGAVVEGDQFDYRGIIMYELRDGKFSRIEVSYNSFVKTAADGTVTSIGLAH